MTTRRRTRLAHGHPTDLEYHRRLLDDPVRLDAYERALRRLVRPGDVVLDLGAGSGILAMIAARLGAARVHAVESMPIAGLARQLIAANGLADIVQLHQADFLDLDVIEPVDLLVSDYMGRWVVDDGMLPVVEQARRWVRPGGRACPATLDLWVAPVGDFHLRAVDLFEEPLYGLDLTAAVQTALNYCYVANLGEDARMARARLWGRIETLAALPALDAVLTFELERPGRLQAVAGWFDAQLAEGVTLSTAPASDTHWGQYLFPLPPTQVLRGDRLQLRLYLDEGEQDDVWRWAGWIERDGRAVAHFDLESTQRLGQRGPDGAVREG